MRRKCWLVIFTADGMHGKENPCEKLKQQEGREQDEVTEEPSGLTFNPEEEKIYDSACGQVGLIMASTENYEDQESVCL